MRVMAIAFGGVMGVALLMVMGVFLFLVPVTFLTAHAIRTVLTRSLGVFRRVVQAIKDRLDLDAAEDLQDEIAELVIGASKNKVKPDQPWAPDTFQTILYLGRREHALLYSTKAEDVWDYLYGRAPDRRGGFFDRWGVQYVELDSDHESIVYLEEVEES